VLTLACLSAAVAALSLGRRLAPDVNRIELPATGGHVPQDDYLSAAVAALDNPGTA
jgi:hypothetical protein